MSKIYNAIMGLIVGDALGVPYEFQKRDTFRAFDMTGYGTYNLPAGTWSDDSSLTLATVESMARLGRIDLKDIMHNFYKWFFFGEFTPYGETFDVGNTTQMAIYKYRYEGIQAEACGGNRLMDNGNGSLMRILPLAFVNYSTLDIYRVSALTHAHEISQTACEIYIDIADNLIQGINKKAAVDMVCYGGLPEKFERIERIENLSRDEIKSTGYVIDTLEAALWCFLTTDSFKNCVLEAVNLGEDTDTVAAVAGGLAGIYYGIGGEKGIPEDWIDTIARLDYIKTLCDEFDSKFFSKGE